MSGSQDGAVLRVKGSKLIKVLELMPEDSRKMLC